MGDNLFRRDFFPNPVQKQFIESRATADLFSSRRGEGKSTALAWSIYSHTHQNPGARWAVVRDTFENLQKTTMKTFFEWFPPGIFGNYNASKKCFTWYEGVGSGEVYFVGVDDPDDASKFLSWELGGVAMDEPAPALGSRGIAESVFQIASTSLRQPGMNWYPMKLAENNPDESHWTYKYFVDPGKAGYALWQPSIPENLGHLPPDYYAKMRDALASRPDLIRRFIDGEFGYQQEGVQVTPQWNDKIHLGTGLVAIPRVPLYLGWDFGLNPTCIITQLTPLGYWLILHSFVGEGDIGALELIDDLVKPVLAEHYLQHQFIHIGDPNGIMREQSSSAQSAVRVIRDELGGKWRPGPVSFPGRLLPLQKVLSQTIRGSGKVQVDRQNAKQVWYALRGGWHYHVASTGVVSALPKKNIHSHPGDAMGYLAGRLFPIKKLMQEEQNQMEVEGENLEATYFGQKQREIKTGLIKNARPGIMLPSHGEALTFPSMPRGYFGN